VVDKVASVTQACATRTRSAHRRPKNCRPKKAWWSWSRCSTTSRRYNTLELTSGPHGEGRASGDIVVGALGHRKALFGYSGHVPEDAQAAGDVIQMLNIGGVLGRLRFGESRQGQAPSIAACSASCCTFPYLGERIGVPARVGLPQTRLRTRALDTQGVPVVVARRHLHGSRQNGGGLRDRVVACGIAASSSMCFKATGVSLRRDILAMEDAGARNSHDLHRPRCGLHHCAPPGRRSRAPCSPSSPPTSPT
jgi:hypothetical protein